MQDNVMGYEVLLENKTKDFLVAADLLDWKARLIAKENVFLVHKTLGIACLASFVWRIFNDWRF